ncbi:MAG: TonB-dependent receptor [Acidobacteria bacterium]|nr:TonB-dependent receptor [Acidobacteriota bacterium]
MRIIPVLLLFAAAFARAGDTIRIRLLDPQDSSIPGARVEVRAGDAPAITGVSAADGSAVFTAGIPAEVTIYAAGFEPVRRRIVSAGPVTVRMHPATIRSSVDVVVRDEPDRVTTVGTNLEIERTGARTVFDAVEQVVPGAFVTRRGVMGYGIANNGTGGVSIRGVGSSPNTGVLVVVDGRPDFQGLMGHPLPDFYSLSDAGTVTVVEGPASVLYGSNAMGGVVEVKNWEPAERMSTRLTSSFGSFYTGQHRLSHGARFRRGFYSLNAGIAHTKGDRPSSAFRNQDGTLTAGYDLSRVWKASIEGRYGHFHVEDPGPVVAPLSNSYARVGRGGFSANLDNATSRAWGYLRTYSSYGNHFITDGFRSTDHTTGIRIDESVALTPRIILETGSDVVRYGGAARNVRQVIDYGRHDLTDAAGFARAQWTATPRLHVNSGVRYERNSLFGSIAVPEFGAAYTLADGYAISAEAGKGFRNPTIRELYLFPAPNPSLLPERLWNYQVSFQAHPARSLSASVTAFYADLTNLIVAMGWFPNMRLENSGGAINRGVETTLRWRAGRRFSAQAGYAYLRSTNLAPYLPEHKLNYSIEYDAGRALVYFGGMSVSRRWADLSHTRTLDPYTLGTLKITVPLNSKWRLFTALDNLFNSAYQVVPGYPMPGVNAAGGFTVSF